MEVFMPIYIVPVNTAADGAGSADFGPVYGRQGMLDIAYHASAAVGTDLSVLNVGGGVVGTLLVLTNVNSSGRYDPQHLPTDNAGTLAAGTLPTQPNYFSGERLQAVVAGAGTVALTPAVTLYFRTWEG
jgi:hypothetical protein